MMQEQISKGELGELARQCVDSMGDIFWDWNQYSDNDDCEYSDPVPIAVEAVQHSLHAFALRCGVDIR